MYLLYIPHCVIKFNHNIQYTITQVYLGIRSSRSLNPNSRRPSQTLIAVVASKTLIAAVASQTLTAAVMNSNAGVNSNSVVNSIFRCEQYFPTLFIDDNRGSLHSNRENHPQLPQVWFHFIAKQLWLLEGNGSTIPCHKQSVWLR